MIEQGTDGVSRGTLKEGVGTGMDMLQFIPLHQGALERHTPLLSWIKSWTGNKLEVLTPKGWFTRGQNWDGGQKDSRGFWRHHTRTGTFLWAPPPGAAQVALEQLRIALLKRQKSTHVFVCPRLLVMEWIKQLHKACDLVISLPAGVDIEVATHGSVEVLQKCSTWQGPCLAYGKLREWTQGVLCANFSRHNANLQVCRNLWCGACYTSPTEVYFFTHGAPAATDNIDDQDRLTTAWGGRHQKVDDFNHGRDGNHLLLPFKCDGCILAKLKGGVPNMLDPKDKLLLACIRRANLDAFWSRASGTVASNRDKIRMGLKLSAIVGLAGPYQHTSQLPHVDHCDYDVAIQMLFACQRPGKHSKDHLQWDTIRKIRTAFSNQNKAAPQSNMADMSLSDKKGLAQRLVDDKCSSLWFSRFFAGCRRRMGQDVRPNKGMSTDLMVKTLQVIALRMNTPTNSDQYLQWLTFGTYLVVTYVLSLRGVEGLLLDLHGLLEQRNLNHDGESFFMIALLGAVKNENKQHRCHVMPCSNTTSSGINVKGWVKSLVDLWVNNGFNDGPLIADKYGRVLTTQALDDQLVEILEEIFDDHPRLFPPSINAREEIVGQFQVFRTPRRSSTTRATEKNVTQLDIDTVNRWRTFEAAKGNQPAMSMRQRYTLLLQLYLRYTQAM